MLKSIVIVGGGTAGWITAGIIAAEYAGANDEAVSVTLVESKNIGTIGVGEGTWPTMIGTLKKIGISEIEFMQRCDASFKQASKFQQWVTGETEDHYYHPFSLPQDFNDVNVVPTWLAQKNAPSFAEAVSIQPTLCDKKLAPKQSSSPEYASAENHGYHLDAGKFAALLMEHCTSKLNVQHIIDDVVGVNATENNDISSVATKNNGCIHGDLFIDCSGTAALLIDKHYHVPFISKKDVLFIDKAIAVQVPYPKVDSPIASATISTAQTAGWIWDIGLPTRRGVGHVFSSKHISRPDALNQLKEYLKGDVEDVEKLTYREIDIRPGYREKFWVKNCVAVGMSSGFLEPLEASAIVMIEAAANMIAKHLPASRISMDIVAKNYNSVFTFRWGKIIDFLKLHYVLSKRDDSQFWIDNRNKNTIPTSLQDLMTLWGEQPPCNNGFLSPYDLFPAASYQYILYGMGFHTKESFVGNSNKEVELANQSLRKVTERKNKIPSLLPSNRELLKEYTKKYDAVSVKPSKPIFNANFADINFSEISQLTKNHPLFIKKGQSDQAYTLVTLLGFNKDEDLLKFNKNIIKKSNAKDAPYIAQDCLNNFLDSIKKYELLEPVNLDITFNNKQSTIISELYTISEIKLAELPKSIKNEFQKTNLMPIFLHMINSLNNIPTLINIKNKLLAM